MPVNATVQDVVGDTTENTTRDTSSAGSGGGAGTSFSEENVDSSSDVLFEQFDTEKDDNGHIINGTAYHESSEKNGIKYVTITMVSTPGGVYCYFIDKGSYYMLYSVNGDCTYTYRRDKYMNGSISSTSDGSGNVRESIGVSAGFWSKTVKFDTNIPIFLDGDQESIDKYINNGDYSGAENADVINDAEKDVYDESIPMPHNLKVVQGVDQSGATKQTEYIANYNKDVVITWTQDDKLDDMQYDVDVAFSAYRIPDDNFNEIREINTPYYNIVNSNSYGSGSSVTVKLDASQLNKLKDNGFLGNLYIRVRNKVNKKCSNYARITINIQEKTAFVDETETDSKGPDTDDEQASDEYNGTNANGENGGTDLDFSNINVDGIISFIKNGFGLLGDYGIIALMSKCYLYLPGTVWTLIYFFISMMIVISIISLVKKVLF